MLVLGAQGLVAGTAWRVQVSGTGPGADAIVAVLRADGNVVGSVDGVLAAPGPDVDATVVVTADGVLVRVGGSSALAVAALRADLAEAVPGRAVRVLGSDGRVALDVTAHLLPGAVALTSVVLAFPGTAERVARWRHRGTLDLLTGAGGLRGPAGWVLLVPSLVPSRMLLTLPAVGVAVLGCGLTGNLDVGPAGFAGLTATFLLGSTVCTGLGVLGGFLLRSREEVQAFSWSVVALTAVFGGVLVPLDAVPEAAAAALRLSPSSLYADGWRHGLTGGPVGREALLVAVPVVVLALVAVLVQRLGVPAAREERTGRR
jgi:hypothetical protein